MNAVALAGDYDERVRMKAADLAASTEGANAAYARGLADIVQTQQVEIERLQRVLHDAVSVPPRHPVQVAIGTTLNDRGHQQSTLFIVASDRSCWLMTNFNTRPGAPNEWHRLPGLPQAANEADATP